MQPSKTFADPFNMVVAGIGGQGNVLAARLLGMTLTHLGYHVSMGETYGASQRGGAVMSHVRASKAHLHGPLIPEGRAHVVVSLEPMETVRVLRQYGNPEVVCIVNDRPVRPTGLAGIGYPELSSLHDAIDALSRRAWYVNATDMAIKLGTQLVSNVIICGALVGTRTVPITEKDFEDTLQREMGGRRRLEVNLKAFRDGIAAVQEAAVR
ncbi:MAG: indolepyruvate oxidoreductase subunit beta [Chloroflexi bacterium]|nr:indolepyruvate oxidoreductase subunit beta [Chloroflexota bacterium]